MHAGGAHTESALLVGDERAAPVLPMLSLCGAAVERERAALPTLMSQSLSQPALHMPTLSQSLSQPALHMATLSQSPSKGGGVHGLRALAGRQWQPPSSSKAVSSLIHSAAPEGRATGASVGAAAVLDGAVEFTGDFGLLTPARGRRLRSISKEQAGSPKIGLSPGARRRSSSLGSELIQADLPLPKPALRITGRWSAPGPALLTDRSLAETKSRVCLFAYNPHNHMTKPSLTLYPDPDH